MRVLTVKQPFADLIMAQRDLLGRGEAWSLPKDVENRSWPVPSTLPQWYRCGPAVRRSPELAGAHGTSDCCQPDGPFPFTLGIHAAAKLDTDALEAWGAWAVHCEGTLNDVRLGVLLGSVQVTGCHHADECKRVEDNPQAIRISRDEHVTDFGRVVYCSRWAEPDCWHWTLADPEPLDVPVPMRGRQGLWTLTEVGS